MCDFCGERGGLMNLLDKLIDYFNPEAGAKRKAYREMMRYYDAGEINRYNHRWVPLDMSDQENAEGGERNLIRSRCRWLERNSDLTNSILSAMVRNVVNTGIRPQARCENEKLNTKIEALWNEWTRPENCDITGQMGFYEIQRMLIQRKTVDGEVLVKLTVNEKARFPLKLQVIRPDLLDESMMTAPGTGRTIRGGIELDDYLRPVAYWIKKKSPDGWETAGSERIPASEILHLWNKKYPDQIRGISDLAAVAHRVKDLDEYLKAENMAAFMAACYSIFIVKNNYGGVGVGNMAGQKGGLTDIEGKSVEKVRPGMIVRLAQGEDIKAANPGRPSTTASDITELYTRMIGSGMGLSYEMISRDFNGSSYSAARQGNLEDRRTFQPMQQWLITHFCEPVYRKFLDTIFLSGELNLPGYANNKEKYQKAEWIAPGWQSIDPEKEMQADFLAMKSGTLTLSQQCAEHGYDWRDQLDQMAKEKDYAEKLDLTLPIHKPESVQAAESNFMKEEENNDK